MILLLSVIYPGADPGFQVRGGGAHIEKLHRAEGGAKIFGVFRVKNHDFTPKKNHIFPNFRRARAGCAPLSGSDPVIYWILELFLQYGIVLFFILSLC